MKSRILLSMVWVFCFVFIKAQTPINITGFGTLYSESFNSMDTIEVSPFSSNIPQGWLIYENGLDGNNTYRGDTGYSSTYDTYSYHARGSADIAIGSIAGNSLQSTIGAMFVNKTTDTIRKVYVSFYLEQWHSGARTVADTMLFSYGKNTGGLNSGNWTNFAGCNLLSPTLFAPIGALNGNLAANRREYSLNVPNLSISPGDTFYIRWQDVNVAGFNDGLAIDDFKLTAYKNNPPLAVTDVKLVENGTNGARITWTKPVGYNNANMNILVFLKSTNPVNIGVSKKNPNNYTANSNYSSSFSYYQNDNLARCVYKNDSGFVNITGLTAGYQYYALIFAVNNSDSNYSDPAIGNLRTVIGPATNITMTGLSSSSARINWSRPAIYDNNLYTTMVFVKPDTNIAPGSAAFSPIRYIENTNVSSGGSSFDSDPLAKCVYKGDLQTVNIIGMVQSKTYHVVIQLVREADSVYSAPAYGQGTCIGAAPLRTIQSITTLVDSTGIPDSNGVRVAVRGVVYGFNWNTFGLTFVLRDSTGGTTIYSTSKTFNYTVKEGDSLEVTGTVSSYYGRAQISPVDTLIVLGSGSKLKKPRNVKVLGESTENDLIKIDNIRFVTPPAGGIWPSFGGTLNAVVEGTEDTIPIRIYSTSQIAGQPAPKSATFSLIGLGTQQVLTVPPYAYKGYQVIPRTEADVYFDTIGMFNLIYPANDTFFVMEGDTGDVLEFSWSVAPLNIGGPGAITYKIQFDNAGGDFSSPLFEANSDIDGFDRRHTSTYWNLVKKLKINYNESVSCKWRVVAQVLTYNRYSEEEFNLTLKRGDLVSVNEIAMVSFINVFPNPAKDKIYIESNSEISSVKLFDIAGKMMYEQIPNQNSAMILITELKPGIYTLNVSNCTGNLFRKIIVE